MLKACWEKAGAFVHQQIIWVKDRGVLTRSHYLWKHEPCFMGWAPHLAAEGRRRDPGLDLGDPELNGDERPDHPTPKPLDCFAIPMPARGPGGLCYETVLGLGSQIMAGEATGRRVFAMEISPAYVDVAVERWQAETGRGDPRRRRPQFRRCEAERLGGLPTPSPSRDPRSQETGRVRSCMVWPHPRRRSGERRRSPVRLALLRRRRA